MSRPTSSERPRSSGRTYTDEEWDRVKLQFHYYYMEKNMSLKDAAKCMKDNHGFDATLRQWERRIAPEKWGFSKYASRDDRLKAIDASGKSLLDVSQRGRRKSTASDGRPSLLEDRNLRRFARREVSRESRGRARSVSVLSDQPDQDMSEGSTAPSPAPSDMMMDTQEESSFSQPNFDMFSGQWVAASSQDSNMSIPQIRVFDQSQNLAVPHINVSGPDDSYIAPDHIPISVQAQVNVHYPIGSGHDSFNAFQDSIPDQYSGVPMHSGNFATEGMAGALNPTVDWNGPLPTPNQRQTQDFSFAFDHSNSTSFTEMLQLGSHDLQDAVNSIDSQHHHFSNEAPQSPESADRAETDLEYDPDFEDPTYRDVFAVLKEKDSKIMQMISMLKQSCQNSTGAENAMKHVINSITLLEKGVQAQNQESEQDVRRTLKNISSTKSRATRDIYDLSTKRKRKIEQLQAQIDALNANEHDTFPYRCYQGYKDWMKSPSGSLSHSSDGKMIVLHDEDTLLHETVELLGAKLKPALESPTRIRAIVQAIQNSGKHDLRTLTASREDQITAVGLAKATHNDRYLDHIQTVFQAWLDEGLVESSESVLPECFRLHNNAVAVLEPPKDIYARAGYYAFDMSTGITRDSWKSIIASANLAVKAAQLLIPKQSPFRASQTTSPPPSSVLALCRPPGHHCTGQQAGGYCYINNIAVTVTTLRHFSPQNQPHATSTPHPSTEPDLKFAILDLDFHHGNGTQEIFYHDPNVLYVSLHGQDEFPYYTGSTSERGPKDTAAYDRNVNFPLPVGTSAADYKATLQKAIDAIILFEPEYLLLSLGFDTFHLDPLGKFDIMTEDYREIACMVRTQISKVQAVIILEGGYVVERLGENLLAFLQGWEDAETDEVQSEDGVGDITEGVQEMYKGVG